MNNRHSTMLVPELLVLNKHLHKIRTVSEWARNCCISESSLNKRINTILGTSPKIVLRELRFEVICSLIREQGLQATSQGVAIDSGLGIRSNDLYKFLSIYYGTTFTRLRYEIISGMYTPKLNRLGDLE